MSKTTNITLFPELLNLKQTINQLQGQYVDAKPKLNVALAGLAVTDVRQPLTSLSDRLALPLDGNLPHDLQECYQDAVAALGNLQKTLTTEGFIPGLTLGTGMVQVFRDTTPSIRNLMEKSGTVNQSLENMPGGYTKMLTQHVGDRFAEMLVVLTNATFEVLDNYMVPVSPGDVVSSFFAELAEVAKSVSFQPQLAPFREMIGQWLVRWAGRPDLAGELATWMEVASVRVSEPRTVTRYKAGDVLVRLVLAAGRVETVRLSNGRLPVGMELSETGNIVVSDPTKLFASYFDGLELSGRTNQGLKFRLKLPEIVIGVDQPAEYVVSEPLAISDMTDGHVLAAVVDPDGTIVEAQVVGGKFPPGVRFHTATGELAVADISRLKEGSYRIQIVTIDEVGGETNHEIEVVIGSGQSGGKDPIRISVNLGSFELPLVIGEVMATITAEGKPLAVSGIRSGALPKGVELQPDASLMVMDRGQTIGSYGFMFVGQDATGVVYEVSTQLELSDKTNLSGGDGTEIKVLNLAYTNILIPSTPGDLVAEIHVNGIRPVSWKLVSGGFPEGVEMDSSGFIMAMDPPSIKEGFSEVVFEATMTNSEVYRIHLDLRFIPQRRIDINPGRILECTFAVMLPIGPGTVIGDLNPFGLKLAGISPLLNSLPQGLLVDERGQLVAMDPSFLTVGTHLVTLRLQDSEGRHMQLDITLHVADLRNALPAARTIMRLGTFSLPSVAGRIISMISMPGDRVHGLAVIAGELPSGLSLSQDGALCVQDATALIPGRYGFGLRLQGANGGTTIAEVHLELASRQFVPATNRRYYMEYPGIKLPLELGATLGVLQVENAPVTDCVMIGGDLPAGIQVKDGGEFVVMGATSIDQNFYDVLISCAVRGRQGSEVVVRLGFDSGSMPSKEHSQAFLGLALPIPDGQLIATVTADGAPLENCTLIDGKLPAGTELDVMGRIVASAKLPRTEGLYGFVVSGRGVDGSMHVVKVTMEFVGSQSSTFFQLDLGAHSVDQIKGAELGVISYKGIGLRNMVVVGGAIPFGTTLDGFGALRVNLPGELKIGDFLFEISAQDAAGVAYRGEIKVFLVGK